MDGVKRVQAAAVETTWRPAAPGWTLASDLFLIPFLAASLFIAQLAVATPPQPVHADGQPTVHDVAGDLMCQCSCSMTVAACQEAMECSVAADFVQNIQRRLEAGESKQEILDRFASIYGEQVLASPRKSGFGLTAWVTPFMAVISGGIILAALVRAWVRRRSAPLEGDMSAGGTEDLDHYQGRVDEELRLLE
jgi:cytochrome c-type biogenesis protein CcmH